MKTLLGIAALVALSLGSVGASPAHAACDTQNSTEVVSTGWLPYGTRVVVYEGGPYGYQVEDQFSILTGCSDPAIDQVMAVVDMVPLP
jgi:hypothetical protein